MSRVLKLSDDSFGSEVLQSDLPVLVEFSASWCLPSRQQAPVLAKLADELYGKMKIGDLNIDRSPNVSADYQIMGCPTFIVFRSGTPLQRKTGAQSKKQLLDMIEAALA